MSSNKITIAAAPDTVFAILMDATAYPRWVVGAKRIRAVDDDWPAVGSRFHHTVGPPGVDVDDSSKLLAVETNRKVVLEVRFRPFGVGIVTLLLDPIDGGRATEVEMLEVPTSGPVRSSWSRPLSRATWLRNAWALRRLKRIAER